MKKTSKSQTYFRGWVRDRIVFLALVIFIIGASGYIGAGKIFDPDGIWVHPVKEFALLLSLVGVVSLGYELFLRELTFREYKDALEELVNPHAVRLGIQGIFKNRSELGQSVSFEGLFKNVKREIFIGGTSLLSISSSSRELLKEKVLNGIQVKLLLMDPDSSVVELITKQGGGKPTFLNEIKTSLLLLQKLQHELEEEGGHSVKEKFQVHTYGIIPSHSFVSIDMGDPGGLIVADIGPYLGRSTPRPSMIVTNKKDGIYEYWKEMSNLMWADSKPALIDTVNSISGKTKTLLFTSGRETEYYDAGDDTWQPAAICRMNGTWRGIKGSNWIWIRESVTLEEARTGTQKRFRLKFEIPPEKEKSVVRAELFIRSDDVCHITVNDVGLKQEFGGSGYPDPFLIGIDKYIKSGENTLYCELICFAKPDAEAPEDNLTGLIYRLHLEYRE